MTYWVEEASLGASVTLEKRLVQTDSDFPSQFCRKLKFTSSGDHSGICCRKSLPFILFCLIETTFLGNQAFARFCKSNTTSFSSEDSKAGSSEANMSVQSPGSLQQPSGRGISCFSFLSPPCMILTVIHKTCKRTDAHPY